MVGNKIHSLWACRRIHNTLIINNRLMTGQLNSWPDHVNIARPNWSFPSFLLFQSIQEHQLYQLPLVWVDREGMPATAPIRGGVITKMK